MSYTKFLNIIKRDPKASDADIARELRCGRDQVLAFRARAAVSK